MTAPFRLENRLADILESTVREFIRHGEPVSSERLYDRYDFGIRPARIRSELQELTEEGYLEQPHHSAGRIPTDSGYEFFVNRVLEREVNKADEKGIAPFSKLFQRSEWTDFLAELSNKLGVLSVLDAHNEGKVYKNGLDKLVENISSADLTEILEVIRDFEQLEERIERVHSFVRSAPLRVFIGRKSPLTKSEHLSVVGREYGRRQERVTVLVIGPKRMDYEKVVKIFMRL